MRSIAGQLAGFNFNSVSQGVSGGDAGAIFQTSWQTQINAALVGSPDKLSNLQVQQFGTDVHLGATIGSVAPLPDLSSNVQIPDGSAFAIYVAIDTLLSNLTDLFGILTVAGGHITLSGSTPLPDATSPYVLSDMQVTGNGAQWTITLSGHVVVGNGIPDVGIQVTANGTLVATGGGVAFNPANSLSVTNAPLSVSIDPNIVAAAADFLLSIFLPGIEVTGGIAAIVAAVEQVVAKAFAAYTFPIGIVSLVAGLMPQRIRLDGTADNLWLQYDSVEGPAPFSAKLVEGQLVPSSIGQSLRLTGRFPVTRYRRIASVTLSGPSIVRLASLPASEPYVAIANDEVVNPVFKWSVIDETGKSMPATIQTPNAASTNITFDPAKLPAPVTFLRILVEMDDDLHLKDASGSSPQAVLEVSVSSVSAVHPIKPTPIPTPKT